ncbi:MAG: hypothetical protein FGM32_01120 [Candidatus Kapabacteria bacterium]|nr:hypothetical protein [Candidatus Kapabacteria bacterium]
MKRTQTVILGGLISLAMVFAGVGCSSPLDTTAPRKETPVTPAPLVTPTSTAVSFTTAYGSFAVRGLPTFKVDTSTTPMRFWFDVAMEAVDTAGKSPLLHSFRLRLDSALGDGMIITLSNRQVEMRASFGQSWGGLQTYWSDDKTNTASMVIAEHPREAGKPRTVTVTLYLFLNKDNYFRPARQEQILGTFTLVL